jgi:hypothetical protein
VGKVFGKLAGITGWFVGFVREVSRGIAVGRLRNGTRVVRAGRQARSDGSPHGRGHRDADSGLRIARRMARIEARVRQRKKWNAGG